jgi:hypothetical protein
MSGSATVAPSLMPVVGCLLQGSAALLWLSIARMV